MVDVNELIRICKKENIRLQQNLKEQPVWSVFLGSDQMGIDDISYDDLIGFTLFRPKVGDIFKNPFGRTSLEITSIDDILRRILVELKYV
jgi:hypothetical protein